MNTKCFLVTYSPKHNSATICNVTVYNQNVNVKMVYVHALINPPRYPLQPSSRIAYGSHVVPQLVWLVD